MSTLKRTVHEMIDDLPEEKIVLLKQFLEDLLSGNDEHSTWLDADLAELPPYDWGADGPPRGKAVRYQPGIGLVIREDHSNEE